MDAEMSDFSCEANKTSDYFQVVDDNHDFSPAVNEEPANESKTSTKITLSYFRTAIVEEPAYFQIIAYDSDHDQNCYPADTQVKTNGCNAWTSDHNKIKSSADDNNYCQDVDNASGYLQSAVHKQLTECSYLQPVDIFNGYSQATDEAN